MLSRLYKNMIILNAIILHMPCLRMHYIVTEGSPVFPGSFGHLYRKEAQLHLQTWDIKHDAKSNTPLPARELAEGNL
jgi:hypothetical protein